MSFLRLIYWSAIIGGWSAFVGWLIAEILMGRWIHQSAMLAVLMASLVACFLGAGIAMLSGLLAFRWSMILFRGGPGLVGGFIAGFLGSLLGNGLTYLMGSIGLILGWMILGLAIGAVEGIVDQSVRKIRNGLIGGALGGLLGGLLFIPISRIVGSPMSSRAFGFVILGMFIGLFIGLVQVILKDAWLTVQEGFRPGRQLILGTKDVAMGTSEKADLIFIAMGAKGVEPLHLRIRKEKDGSFTLEDNQSRTGTMLNGERITQPTTLTNGDVIQFGVNKVQFRETYRQATAGDSRRSRRDVSQATAAGPPPLPTGSRS
ncbi:MAG: FHA domain-containing protein [Gemmataceae bacterium]|nr:FHA domain-containing protein [Gemmataceae bacterium]